MAITYNPQVPTLGLVGSFDAGNDKSFSRNAFLAQGTSGPGAASNNNATFPASGTGTFVRLGYGQSFGGYTIQGSDVVYRYDLTLTGCHYKGYTISIPSGLYGTISFDYYVSTDAVNLGTNGNINYLGNFEGALSTAVTCPNFNLGVWQRVTATAGPSSAGNCNILLYPGACGGGRLATGGYILYKNPLVEFTNTDTRNTTSKTSFSTWNNLADTSKNGTITNSLFSSNGAMIFTGTQYVTVPTLLTGNSSTAFTLIGVARTTTTSGYGTVIGTNGTWRQIGFGGGNFYFGGNAGGGNLLVNGGAISTNTWYHMALTFDGTTAYGYLNGTQISGSIGSNGGTIGNTYLGSYNSAGNEALNGSIALAQVYNRALTQTEITTHYNALKGRFGF